MHIVKRLIHCGEAFGCLTKADRAHAYYCFVKMWNGPAATDAQQSAYGHFVAATTKHSPGTSKPSIDSKLRMEACTSFHTDSRS